MTTAQYPDVLAPRSLYQGPASFDTPNHFSLSESLKVPGVSGTNRYVRAATNGWVLSGSVILQSGTPFTVLTTATFQPTHDAAGNVTGLRTGSGDYNGDGKNYDFPNAPAAGYSQPTDRRSYINGIFPASNFTIPTLGTEGNELRNGFRGPGYANTDVSVLKSFPVADILHFELRETPSISSTAPTSPACRTTFPTPTSAKRPPRLMPGTSNSRRG